MPKFAANLTMLYNERDFLDRYREALAYGYFMWAITRRVERRVIETFVARLGSGARRHLYQPLQVCCIP